MIQDIPNSVRQSVPDSRVRHVFVTVAFCILLSLSMAPVAAQFGSPDAVEDFGDDFEDGNADGWRNVETDTDPEVRETSTEGTYSLYVDSTMIASGTDNPSMEWVSGPVIDMSESVDITGTVQYDANVGGGVTQNVRVGLTGNDQNQSGENMYLLFDYGSGETRIGTSISDTSGEAINDDFRGEWVRYRLASDADDGTLRAKVWPASETEPDEWQITRSGFEGEAGAFGVNPGYNSDANRQIWLDSVAVEGTLATDENLTIETSSLLRHDESNPYEVKFRQTNPETGRNETIDVTDEAEVISLNTSAVEVNDANNTLEAIAAESFNGRVGIRADYNNSTAYTEVAVAEVSMENLAVLPPVYRIGAFLGDWTIFLFIVAIGAGIVGTRIATSFMGLSMMEMVLVIGWFGGYISTGLILTSVFACLFIGLNLAANIDYQVTR